MAKGKRRIQKGKSLKGSPFWSPKSVGEVINFEFSGLRDSKYGQVIMADVLDDDFEVTDERVNISGYTVLQDILGSLEKGKRYCLEYLGEKKSESGKNKFMDFDIYPLLCVDEETGELVE